MLPFLPNVMSSIRVRLYVCLSFIMNSVQTILLLGIAICPIVTVSDSTQYQIKYRVRYQYLASHSQLTDQKEKAKSDGRQRDSSHHYSLVTKTNTA